jgi:hypothetical protein
MYGNETDIRTAILAVADSGTRIAAPAITGGGVTLDGFYYGNGHAPAWNYDGLGDIATYAADITGTTCPLNMSITNNINQITQLSQAVCRIGQFNPVIAVDLVNGMYKPQVPPSRAFPQSNAAIASCISRVSRMLTVAGDQAIRAAGIPMNILFNPAAGIAVSGANVNVLSVWKTMYDGINKMLDTQTGCGLTYLGSWFAGYNVGKWISYNTGNPGHIVATARVPMFYMKQANMEWDAYASDSAKTLTFGEYDAANIGYPNVDNLYERVATQAPLPAKTLCVTDPLARLAPMFPPIISKEALITIMMTKGGGNVAPLVWPNMYPSVGISPALSYQNYGIISYQQVNAVDPPLDGTVPVFNPAINNDIYYGFASNSYGYFTRAPQVKYNKHEIANSGYEAYTIIQNGPTGSTAFQSRLTALGGKSGK